MSYPDVMVHFNVCDVLCTVNLVYDRNLECAFHVKICEKDCTMAVIYNFIIQTCICKKDPKTLYQNAVKEVRCCLKRVKSRQGLSRKLESKR